jgi:hypothetical protein
VRISDEIADLRAIGIALNHLPVAIPPISKDLINLRTACRAFSK